MGIKKREITVKKVGKNTLLNSTKTYIAKLATYLS